MKKFNIIYKHINELKEYENNPRHNENAIEYVKRSIEQFGFKNPIIIDKNNVIVCGHTRLESAKQLSYEEVPCIIADDLTEEQINAFRLVDNKTNEYASWDFEKLEEELSNIELLNMMDFGFETHDDIDIDDFFTEAEEHKAKEPKTITCPHCGEEIEI